MCITSLKGVSLKNDSGFFLPGSIFTICTIYTVAENYSMIESDEKKMILES